MDSTKMAMNQLANLLDEREYGCEMDKDVEKFAKENDLVIVYGASDDIMEFRGAINDEIGCYDGGTAYLDGNGLIENKCDDEDCPYYQDLLKAAVTIKADWCNPKDYCWTYETAIPHEIFSIVDKDLKAEGVTYCAGIVFSMDDLRRLVKA